MRLVTKIFGFLRRQPRWRLIVGGCALLLLFLIVKLSGGKSAVNLPTFAARRGPLEITVLEGGSLQALESQEIKCEVRVGYQGTKILRIVEEGSVVSDEDVKTNKVVVELDSSDLQKQIVQQEITYQSAVATLIDAEQNYEIQLNQNLSDIQGAEQKYRFARMDFDKFLGETVTAKIITQVNLDKLLALASTNNVEETSRADEATARVPAASDTPPVARPLAATNTPPVSVPAKSTRTAGEAGSGEADAAENGKTNSIVIDFSQYAHIEALGDGEAKQKLRKFDDDFQVAQKELGQAKTTLEGTKRLFDKGFVTKTDMERDEIAYENSRLKVTTAESARDLFLKYDFLKSAEQTLSAYGEAVREFDKARRVAISKAAQARARLRSAQGQMQVQTRQRDDLNEQLNKCFLRAKKSGLVVYGATRDDNYYSDEERIREGATVRERQTIITIPDLRAMSVKVKIHESYIKKIQKGQKAKITVDAFPDKVLTGEVTKVAVLPDSQNRWMNPDMKVYQTTIIVDGSQDWVKPGMSAKVEILINKLDNCLYVPVQAVSPDGGKQICFVAGGFKPEKREVEIGEMNDEFIEIKKGLSEGERVLLRRPDALDAPEPGKEKEAGKDGKAAPAKPDVKKPSGKV